MFLFVLILFFGLPTQSKCSTFKGTRTRAAVVFIIGFWMLDLANNTVQVGFLNEFAWSKVANDFFLQKTNIFIIRRVLHVLFSLI